MEVIIKKYRSSFGTYYIVADLKDNHLSEEFYILHQAKAWVKNKGYKVIRVEQ